MVDTHLVEVSGLEKHFPGIHAVDGVSLYIDAGEIYGLLGPHGSGKTTLLSVVAGVLEPDGGVVTVGGEEIGPHAARARRSIGFVPPDLAIYPDLTAEQNLVFFGCLNGVRKRDARARAQDVLALLGLRDVAGERVSQWSGARKHVLNIGIGLLNSPRLLILDEPTFGVDAEEHEEILRVVASLPRDEMAVLYATTQIAEIRRLCDRVGVLASGRVVAEVTPAELDERHAELEPVLRRLDGWDLQI